MRKCAVCLSWNLDDATSCSECTSPLAPLPKSAAPAAAPEAPPKPEPWLGPYRYKMVQLSEHIAALKETLRENEAALYMEDIVNRHAKEGWEFFRIDEIFLSISSPAAFGERTFSAPIRTYVVTFRRPGEL